MPSWRTLEQDMERLGVGRPADVLAPLKAQASEVDHPAGALIFSQSRVADRWLFLTKGVAASEQSTIDGRSSIARFFERGQICANLTSAWRQEIASDDLVAITAVQGLAWPDRVFRSELLEGGAFGVYLRLKVMETLLFDKDLICAKTSTDTEMRYRFLEQRYDGVLSAAPQKDVARFLGVTPQGLSRFLKHRRGGGD